MRSNEFLLIIIFFSFQLSFQNTNMKIFELLCEEGNLWAFDTTVGDLSLNLYSLLSLTCNTLDGEQSCLGDISSNFNTSRHSELSSYSKSTSTISSDKLDKKRSHSAVVFVQVLWTTLQVIYCIYNKFLFTSKPLYGVFETTGGSNLAQRTESFEKVYFVTGLRLLAFFLLFSPGVHPKNHSL